MFALVCHSQGHDKRASWTKSPFICYASQLSCEKLSPRSSLSVRFRTGRVGVAGGVLLPEGLLFSRRSDMVKIRDVEPKLRFLRSKKRGPRQSEPAAPKAPMRKGRKLYRPGVPQARAWHFALLDSRWLSRRFVVVVVGTTALSAVAATCNWRDRRGHLTG